MCGIIGIAGKNSTSIPQSVFNGMLTSLSCRGPDDKGLEKFKECIIGQTRLSIIDLSGGHQPMKDVEKNITITFNGEIYNYKELKKELEKLGHRFATKSDTEVILKAYIEYGEKCPKYLDGMFAFAIWDEDNKKLFMARDRFGEKPLYYSLLNEGTADATLIFASEIKAILATGMVKPELDMVSLDNYLMMLCVPPWRTMYKNIHPLQPAHRAIFKDAAMASARYWHIQRNPLSISFADAAQEVRRMMTTSVQSRMIADVEVGTFLSGGIDSSIVTRLAQQESSRKIKSFSAGFEDFIDELPHALAVATLAGTEHHPTQIRTDILESFKKVSTYFDEPFADSSNIPMQLISEFARKSVKVVLSGDGGDELFYGYGQYWKFWNLPRLEKIFLNAFSDPFAYFKKSLEKRFAHAERAALWKDTSAVERDIFSHIDLGEAKTPLEKINLVDIYMILPADMLTKVNRSAMMHSLEVRSPFLNHAMAEFAYNLPEHFKTDHSRGKLILAEAFKDILPNSIFTRKKQGFGGPIKDWLQKPEFKNYIAENLLVNARIFDIFKASEVKKIVGGFYAGNRALGDKVWTLLSLEVWCRSHEYIIP